MPGHEHLVLGLLDEAAALTVVRDDGPDAAAAARLVAEAGGHPLFLRELARAARRGESELPHTVLGAVTLELARLEGHARALADGAAVAGDPFDSELAAHRSPGAAAHWHRTAPRLLPAGDLARRAELLEQLATAQSDAGRLGHCRATLLEALAPAAGRAAGRSVRAHGAVPRRGHPGPPATDCRSPERRAAVARRSSWNSPARPTSRATPTAWGVTLGRPATQEAGSP